ncbi:C40 family peptidase [Streptomyces sannanensis]|uniref:C40 family peptidase n=1 Tax=Streptomyces sannanensis TaxID=285536 RepID=A0ABP6S7Z4_9ACTN
MASHRRSSHSGLAQSHRFTVLTAAAATAAAALGVSTAGAEPLDPAAALSRIDTLFEQAEKATEQYNTADELAERLRERVADTQDSVARGQERINRMRAGLGLVAGAQYRSGGMDPTLALLLSERPDIYLDSAAVLDRIAARQAEQMRQLREAQRKLGQQRAEATRELAELERARTALARNKRTVESKLAEARRLLNALPYDQRAAYGRTSRSGRGWQLPGLGAASPRAAAAVLAVRRALGRPYVWGANGPYGFDCSGLTQWAYRQAGVGLPRTSQAQRGAGRQVSLAEARPGDLVTYRSDAGHIAMYMGNGQVVHAPYPGASVRYDPVGMMPISAVTRI